jgi:peptide-N4-(N-acetyl-beta-glucosaminyl)asparagine amidase
MKALTSIRRSRTLRSTKVKTKCPQECWPNPQKSVGRFLGRIGSNNCWKAVGPVRTIFLRLGQDIKQYLDKYSEPTPSWITWSIYMVGSLPEIAVPTIIFCSEDEFHRKTIRNTIRDSSILEAYAGIALKHLPRAPDYNQLVQLASSPGNNDLSDPYETIPRRSVVYGPCIINAYDHPSIGHALHIKVQGRTNVTRKATAGGAIRICGKYCLTTAAHAFNETAVDPSEDTQKNEDLCFSDEDDSEEEDSMSELSFSSDLSGSPDGCALSNPCSSRSSSTAAPFIHEHSVELDAGFEGESEPGKEPYPDIRCVELPDWASPIGEALYLSSEKDQDNLDYALIRLNDETSRKLEHNNKHSTTYVDFPDLTDADQFSHLRSDAVVVHTTSAGVVTGVICATPVYMRVPEATSYQETYQVRLREPLVNGDCGSWVCDAQTGRLHGHIVAGSPNGAAYIIPAYKIFDESNGTSIVFSEA